MKLLAIDLFPDGGFRGFGPLGLENNPTAGLAMGIFSKFISSVIGLMTIIAIIWFVFLIMGGAISIITSGGDKQALESAKKKISSGIIGLVVTVLAIFIIQLIGAIIGIPDILNVSYLFELLAI